MYRSRITERWTQVLSIVVPAVLGCGDAQFGPAADAKDLDSKCSDLVDNEVVTDENFEGGATGWSNNATDNTEPAFTEFLGRHAAAVKMPTEVVSKRFFLSGDQTWVSLGFDLYQIDSWDKEDFLVYVDGKIYDWRGIRRGEPIQENPMTAFLGPFRTGIQPHKTYELDGAQTQVTIEFDFYQIDSWDDEPFEVYIDGDLAIHHQFSGGSSVASASGPFPNGQYTASTIKTGELGFGLRGDSRRDGIHHYTLILDSTASSVTLGFQMVGNEPAYNEAFGIDNIVITTNSNENTVIANEDFEQGPEPDWNQQVWYSNPTVTTIATGPIGFGSKGHDKDGIHRYQLAIPTKSTDITIGFGDTLNQDALNETFGIDNFVLTETCAR